MIGCCTLSCLWTPLAVVSVALLLPVLIIRTLGRRRLSRLREPRNSGDKPVVVGLFHPYCNAGGGGERVLWTAIRALQNRYPNVRCVIYTGDHDASREEILSKAQQRFNITLPRTSSDWVEFVYLYRRGWVEASPYPILTLLGQSIGSLVLGFEALLKGIPDIYLDTMGYAFTLPLFRFVGGCEVGCYVHYPTISTDMLQHVSSRVSSYNNRAFISRSPILSRVKLLYYKLFAYLYGLAGKCSSNIMVNSTWTYGHVCALWKVPEKTNIVYPPCDVEEFLKLTLDDKSKLPLSIVSVSQFRPEKDHPLQVKAFADFLSSFREDKERSNYRLVLVGGCRNPADEKRVHDLKNLCKSLDVEDLVDFRLNVSFAELKKCLSEATVGLHTMWNEHFGISVVECMAAGTVVLAHDSGGPKLDIVRDFNGHQTGFLASDVETYSQALTDIFNSSPAERLVIQTNARESVMRFGEKEFEQGFLLSTESLFTKFRTANE